MINRIAMVSAPGGSAFMAELLDVVADSLDECGLASVRHCATIDDLDDGATAFVVIPHEYFVIAGPPSGSALSRTIGLCVEHPGTATFDTSLAAASRLAARFDINEDSRIESRRRGVSSERYQLGYSRRWDRRADAPARDIDVLYMGTADPRRLAILARLAEPLRPFRTELFVPPHEPMTTARPDFLPGPAKWQVMARSRVVLNLHREASTAFEWVRALEAICNGAVVVTEPSSDLAPLVAGEQLLVARPHRLAAVMSAALEDEQLLTRLAASALDAARTQLDPIGSARRLGDIALSLPSCASITRPPLRRTPAAQPSSAPLAEWVPTVRALPGPRPASTPQLQFIERVLDEIHALAEPGRPRVSPAPAPVDVDVDVICVATDADGPVSLTLDSLPVSGVAVHLAFDGIRSPSLRRWDSICSVLVPPVAIGRARCRNALLGLGQAPLVLVLDAGDELMGDTLAQLSTLLRGDDQLDVAYCMARLGHDQIVNLLIPESRRLRGFSYLTRGYLVRRSWLTELGGFTTARRLQELADHDFWNRGAAAGARVVLRRQIGASLWPRVASAGTAEREYGAVEELEKRRETVHS